ncbi:hypothetical protein Dimus_017812 [Dionaea muscipula]
MSSPLEPEVSSNPMDHYEDFGELNDLDEEVEDVEVGNDEINPTTNGQGDDRGSNPGPNDAETENKKESSMFTKKKRPRTSKVWADFKQIVLVGKTKKAECVFCKKQLAILQSGATTHLFRYLQGCVR